MNPQVRQHEGHLKNRGRNMGTMRRSDAVDELRQAAIELSALSESGLAYSTDRFDIERFHRIGQIAQVVTQTIANQPIAPYDHQVASAAGYATPKIDVRAGIFNDEGQVLLVQEIADENLWTLPGGWCDVLETPRQAIEREVLEEAGVCVRARHLAAVIDREQWPHLPAYDRHIYKLFFVCEVQEPVDLSFTSDETSKLGWFSVEHLPELSVSRVLPKQITLLCDQWRNPGPAYID